MDFRATERREFLKLAGWAVLSVQVLPLAGCDSEPEGAPPDSLSVTSSRASKLGDWAAHVHLLYVPLQALRAPPEEGVTLPTTRTYFHAHEVTLTRAQLAAIAGGGTVEVAASGGAHAFSIALGGARL